MKALMLLSLDGDEDAYRRLLHTIQAMLRSYYVRRINTVADVDDLIQETLMAVHQRRMTYDRNLPFTVWLFAVARHKLVDHFRRSKVRNHVGIEFLDDIADQFTFDAVTANMDVARLLDSLSPLQRDMVRQVRIEGHSVAEAAASGGRSEAVVKVSVHRGLKALASKFKGQSQ
nr:sigma-70 family RNA polymerase sigma factor [Rhizobium sp. 16-449-1b]